MFFGEGLSYNKKNCWREPGMSDDACFFHLQTFCGSLAPAAGFPRDFFFYLLTRGFNWEVEFNMKVAQLLSEHKGYSHF